MKISRLFKFSVSVAIVSGVFIYTTAPTAAQTFKPVPIRMLDKGRITHKKLKTATLEGKVELIVSSDKQSVSGEPGSRVIVHSGSVDLRYGIYHIQADKVTIYEASHKIIAEGNVIFNNRSKRIKRSKLELNYKEIK